MKLKTALNENSHTVRLSKNITVTVKGGDFITIKEGSSIVELNIDEIKGLVDVLKRYVI